MKKSFYKLTSFLLVLAMLIGITPIIPVAAADPDPVLSDGYITVTVSRENGGFSILTEEGDKLNKSDNNKKLLYHSGKFDTSFTSFKVTYTDNSVKEYLFGGDYKSLSSNITTTQDATGITSEWTVDGLTFTQRIELAQQGAAEHGMVYISYKVKNNKTAPVSVKTRVLLDTSLGSQDYAIYEVVDEFGAYRTIKQERIITAADRIPANFFAYNDNMAPSITAYTVNNPLLMPYQIAFAHWNSLASTLFEFTPDTNLAFTNQFNEKYLTADSAVAYYYDMGTAMAGAEGNTVTTYYGVYSNQQVSTADSVAINLTAPTSLTLAADKKTYLPSEAGLAPGVFKVNVLANNFASDIAKDFGQVTIAAYATTNVTPLDENGNDLPQTTSYSNPYTVQYNDFYVGRTQTRDFYFKAAVGPESVYHKIELRAFDTTDPQKPLTQENLIGSRYFYILCPGGDGKFPEVIFTGASPQILYTEGTRHMYITGKNFNMLKIEGAYNLRAYSKADPTKFYDIPYEQIIFPEDVNGENIIDVAITDTMPPGSYELVFDWTGEPPIGIAKRMTAPALNFTVSNDNRYRNDYYGIVAVVQTKSTTGRNSKYEIKTYKVEDELEKDKGNYEEVLLVFRGSFDVSKRDANKNPSKLTATSITKSSGGADNVITINNCIDFEKGTLTIERTDNSVIVDFDGELLTSIKRSKIWSGVSTFTELKDGVDFNLVKYNNRGDRLTAKIPPQNSLDKPQSITLIWPSGLSIAQTIGGMAFNLAFGEMGIVYDVFETTDTTTDIIKEDTPVYGYSVSFSASLDLSFLVPGAKKVEDDGGWSKIQEQFAVEDQNGTQLRDRWNGLDYTANYMGDEDEEKKPEKVKGQASVMVRDIMYGCGEGFMGVNFNVNLTLPPYTSAMPTIKGSLAVNTIGGWRVEVDGECKIATLELEASIRLIGHNGIPIPDKLYFYIGGFEPGINIDGFGVIWITGGGGGFDNLYDTIFAPSGIPPLTLMLSISFDIMKILQARADLSISLRGINLKASDIGIKYLKIIVLKKIQVGFEWYPEFYFMASVDASIFDIIRGQGYIVIMEDAKYKAFVEFFIRATIGLPEVVPLLGGMTIGSVDLGANNDRIWGALTALGITLGVTYYWGEDVHFGTGSDAKPSFPELLDYPIGYDEETGQTLYMSLGGNVSVGAMSEIVEDINAAPQLLGTDDSIKSNLGKDVHKLILGAFSEPRALTIAYDATDIGNAKALAQQIFIKDNMSNPLSLTFYDPTLANEATANANVTYNAETQRAFLNVTFTDALLFDQYWDITTPMAADILLYDIASIPELTALSSNLPGNMVEINWNGKMLDDLDSLSFYLTSAPNSPPSSDDYIIGSLENSADITSGSARLNLPENLQSGNYYVRAVYSQKEIVNGTFTSSDKLTYVNPNQPNAPSGLTMTNSGDLNFSVSVGNNTNTDYDGYMFNLYEFDGTKFVLTDFAGMQFEKTLDENGNTVPPTIRAGGLYNITTTDDNGNSIQKTLGLTAGNTYRAGISAYKYIYENVGDTIPAYSVYSNEILSDGVILLTATPPNAKLFNATTFKLLTRTQVMTDENGIPYNDSYTIDTFATRDVAFDVGANVAITGNWVLDDGKITGNISATANGGDRITLSDLDDGDHTITIRGTDNDGDSYFITKTFAIDTKPPKLMLTSPTNGSFFDEDGKLAISGITDPDAKLIVVVDGEEAVETIGGKFATVDPFSGAFSFDISTSSSAASHYVQIFAIDEMDNSFDVEATVVNRGLGNIEKLEIYMDGVAPSNNNLPSGNSGVSRQLSLAATTAKGNMLLLDNSLIDWSTNAVEGNAEVDTDGILSVGANSMGIIIGRFYVSPTLAVNSDFDAAMSASATFGAENNSVTNIYSVTVNPSTVTVQKGTSYTFSATVNGTNSPSQAVVWTVEGGIAGTTITQNGALTIGATETASTLTVRATSTIDTTKSGTATVTVANDVQPQKYTITFNANGGSVTPLTMQTGTDGKLAGLPVPARGNYSFNGWFTAITDGNKITTSTVFTADTVIYAHWIYNDNTSIPDNGGPITTDPGGIKAKAGEFVSVNLPQNVDANVCAPYCYISGVKIYVKLSAVIDGRMYFIAPYDAAYFIEENRVPFIDVSGHWAELYIRFATAREIFMGVSATEFDPNGGMTRAMFVTILGRLANADVKSNAIGKFTDVENGSWYAPYVSWAAENGIVKGYSDTTFGPNDLVTREQMCTMLKRYIDFAEYSLPLTDNQEAFADQADISSWALDAVIYCQRAGLVQGKGENRFDPTGTLTRAEASTVFERLIKIILTEYKNK